jgi:sugar lactone lactonase YvrE
MKNYILITVLSVLCIACNKNESNAQVTPAVSLQNNYTVTSAGLYPEGIDYDTKNEQFIFGSMYKGAVYAMNPKGVLSTFATSNQLVLVTGVYTDETRNRLIVANADLGISEKSTATSAGSIATVEIYNLTTKELIKQIDLKNLTPNAGSCANDIAVDANGNIYVTDSFSPIIYKIDSNYTASVFATNTLFQPASGAFGLNGIVFHPNGYLLVAKTDNAKLFKVPLSNPTNVTEVTGMTFSFPDGLEWNKNMELVIVENGLGLGKTHTFSSTNNWTSAIKIGETIIGKEEFPTTATLASNGSVYVLSSKLGKLLASDKTQSTYSIQKIN